MICVLLPIFVGKRDVHQDLERALCNIRLLDSFNTGTSVLRVNLLAPARDLPIVKARVSRLTLSKVECAFFADEDLVSGSVPNGWVKQQILKLSFCATAEQPFILVLDADTFCCHPFDETTFFIDGRCRNSWEGRDLHGWFEASSRLLGVPFDKSRYGIGVTPEVLSRDICAALLAHLGTQFGTGWAEAMFKARQTGTDWSEYSLYTVFAEMIGALGKYHASPDEMFRSPIRMTSVLSRWSGRAFTESNLRRIFTTRPIKGLFIVNQSTANLAPGLAFDIARQAATLQDRFFEAWRKQQR